MSDGFAYISIKGALAYALRDLMVLEGQEINWKMIDKMVNEEIWPRMCQWMGLDPNFAPNIAQVRYQEDELVEFVTSQRQRHMPWKWDGRGYIWTPEDANEDTEDEGEDDEVPGQICIIFTPDDGAGADDESDEDYTPLIDEDE